jgi:hypothetical protein
MIINMYFNYLWISGILTILDGMVSGAKYDPFFHWLRLHVYFYYYILAVALYSAKEHYRLTSNNLYSRIFPPRGRGFLPSSSPIISRYRALPQ